MLASLGSVAASGGVIDLGDAIYNTRYSHLLNKIDKIQVRKIEFDNNNLTLVMNHDTQGIPYRISKDSIDTNGDVYYSNADGKLIRAIYPTGGYKELVSSGMNNYTIVVCKDYLICFPKNTNTITILSKATGAVVKTMNFSGLRFPETMPNYSGGCLNKERTVLFFELRDTYGSEAQYWFDTTSLKLDNQQNGSSRAVFASDSINYGRFIISDNANYVRVMDMTKDTGTQVMYAQNPSGYYGRKGSFNYANGDAYALWCNNIANGSILKRYDSAGNFISIQYPSLTADSYSEQEVYALKSGICILDANWNSPIMSRRFVIQKYGETTFTYLGLGDSTNQSSYDYSYYYFKPSQYSV